MLNVLIAYTVNTCMSKSAASAPINRTNRLPGQVSLQGDSSRDWPCLMDGNRSSFIRSAINALALGFVSEAAWVVHFTA